MIEALDREHAAVGQRVRTANTDLPDRIVTSDIHALYDRAADEMLITFGPNQPALTHQIADQVFVRLDPETFKIIGVEIIDVRARLATEPALFDIFVDALALAGDPAVVITGSADPAGVRLTRHLRELVAG